VYLSFRIQFIALQVSVPVGIAIVNTVVFGLLFRVWGAFGKLKSFHLILWEGYLLYLVGWVADIFGSWRKLWELFIHTPTLSFGITFEVFVWDVFSFGKHGLYSLSHMVYPIFLYFHTWFNIQTTNRWNISLYLWSVRIYPYWETCWSCILRLKLLTKILFVLSYLLLSLLTTVFHILVRHTAYNHYVKFHFLACYALICF